MQTLPRSGSVRTAKYLVCVDSREESRVALRLACMKANARGNSVGIVHVIAPADFFEPLSWAYRPTTVATSVDVIATSRLEKLRRPIAPVSLTSAS